ncbi:YeeE/YedE thiosulfate transporter family protein [Anaerosalibacter massiliensis]|uniref:YeeE/YedE thiosulfate transporter family protein n=1 Tax=Anaerosalibacter massiliensis TaxID=1347392 RepID=A0A9X2MLB8_9FIRM|nr:YeeE/YedE thiosulfate transporter family protein [Anaerosalibacter massiliensis]MCR2045160.1 YeeE/YedE thiosulfate transporter family protein [Anaerosalibacter massiliensis]
MGIKNSPYYKKFLKNPWSYITGAVLLAIFNIAIFIINGSPWGVTTTFSYWGAWIFKALGGHPESWAYFQGSKGEVLANGFFSHTGSIMNIGIIVGALLASLLASEFKIKKIKSGKQVVAAILGGLLMGYGARISFGCNIGALFSGMASMSLHGWEYLIFIFLGAWTGSKLLVNYFI